MNWYVIVLAWIAVSFTVAGFIGRAIRFGMSGELTPPVERAEASNELIVLN